MLLLTVQAKEPSFEVASLRLSAAGGDGMTTFPDPKALIFTMRNANLEILISIAYGVNSNRVEHEPGWASSTLYDVMAKPEGEKPLTDKEMEPLLQQLLGERLHLVAHRESRLVKGYALVVSKGGPKLTEEKGPEGMLYIMANGLSGHGVGMKSLASVLGFPLGVPVMDKTGLEGTYNLNLKFAPKEATDSDLPSLPVALQEQMGLRLEPAMVPVDFVVIDHVDKVPVEN
jgi:uncharacterized protein (TIGR03435 family)